MSNVPNDVLDFFRQGESFLLSTHINPDGDGLGAAMALRWALLRLGKTATFVVDSPRADTYDFFGDYEATLEYDVVKDALPRFHRVIVVDAPHLDRLGGVKDLIAESAEILIIDHHPVEKEHGTCRYIDQSASSSAEMALRIIEGLGFAPDKGCADYIYTGMLIDTGRFRFSNTSGATLRAAATLLDAGAEPHTISERLFYHRTPETTHALARLLDSITLHQEGKIATCFFTHAFVTGDEWPKVDSEGFVNHALAIIGVEVAALFREVEPGVTRASLRAKHGVDVNLIANGFGGGGHAKAAGCTIAAPLDEAIKQLVSAVALKLP